MKTYSYIFALACIVLVACKEKVPNHHIEYEGKYYREPNPVQYDSNGDGKIDQTDDVIEVLGNSLNVSQAPGGGLFIKPTKLLHLPEALPVRVA